MPEGDTLFRAARTLRQVLDGRTLRAGSVGGADLAGRRVERVEAHGKNLVIGFDDGRALHTHLRMTGSWHVYRAGERWRRAAWRARAVLETSEYVAVCFDAPVVDLLDGGAARERLARLGPDVLGASFDLDAARGGVRAHPEREIGEVLMTQSVVAGIGNVYKSEVLFACRVDPFARVAELGDAVIEQLLTRSRELMSANLEGFPRRTRFSPGERYWVYRRRGRPCRRCGTPIRSRRQGQDARTTYWCPSCQGAGGGLA